MAQTHREEGQGQRKERGCGGKINYKEYQQEIGRKPPFSIKASSVTKGIVFPSTELFDSLSVWAFSFLLLIIAVLLYRMVEKINRWKREG